MTAASSFLALPVPLNPVSPDAQLPSAAGFEGTAWAMSLDLASERAGQIEPLSVLVFTVSLGTLSVISLVALAQVLGLS